LVDAFVNINIFLLKINSFKNASAGNIVQNLLADWRNFEKKNKGYGQNFGDESMFVGTQSLGDDKD
jgi:hypothetical protein